MNPAFKRTINWNKQLTKNPNIGSDWNLDYLNSPEFQEVNRIFPLSFENESGRRGHAEYYLLKVEIKDYNVKINGQNCFDQPVSSEIRKTATGQGDDYTTRCLLDYSYFKLNQKLVAIDISKQQALDADPRLILNLERDNNKTQRFF